MSNIYRLFKIFGKLRNYRLKLAAIYLLHQTGRRYIGVFLDPVLSCNFRCRMCYFSDEARRRELHGVLALEDYNRMAEALFHRALKLQIGCGAEPTLYKNLEEIIRKARACGVPYISMTTNGFLLNEEKLLRYVEAGLNEITLSVHGTCKETYEYFMTNGSFEQFTSLLQTLGHLKKRYPAFQIRINYTMNEDNVEELARLPELLQVVPVDVLQLRPVQKIGEHTSYSNFSMARISEVYDSVLLPLQDYCVRHGITCLIPGKDNLTVLEQNEADRGWMIQDLTYCYISPDSCWKEDFDSCTEDFESYSKRTKRARRIWHYIFSGEKRRKSKNDRTRSLNYKLK